MTSKCSDNQSYEFGRFRLDLAARALLREGQSVPLTPKAFDTLVILVEHSGSLVEKDELMRRIWPDTFVEEANLANNISTLRKVLGEDPQGRQFIETVPKKGYRFSSQVKKASSETIPSAETPSRGAKEAEPVYYGKMNPLPNSPSQSSLAAGIDRNEANEVLQTEPISGIHYFGFKNSVVRKRIAAFGLAVILLCIAVAGFIYVRSGQKYPSVNSANAFQSMSVVRLTSTHNATEAAISPDGKYVAYVVNESGQRNIWIRQVATGSNVQILPPSELNIYWLIFSPNGEYVYYIAGEGNVRPSLYQVPALGGPTKKLMEGINGPIAVSPDGRRFAYIRWNQAGEIALAVANAFSASEEKIILTRKQPDSLNWPAWSPDGKNLASVACTVTGQEPVCSLIEVPLAGGTERQITTRQWRRIGQIGWLGDGSGLIATVADQGFGPYQLWEVAINGGEATRITNDLNNYPTLSLAADSNALVSIQSDIHPSAWVGSIADTAQLKQITSGYGTSHDYWGFSWTPAGKILYGSTAGGNQDIWEMDADGKNQKQLTVESRNNFDPAATPDGRYIVFASDRSGVTNIWRMDADGKNAIQITKGERGDFLPSCSPDSRWIVYTSTDEHKLSLWKVSIDGGKPVRLTDQTSAWPSFSPDGRFIACWHANEKAHAMGLAILPAEGGPPVKLYDIPSTVNTWSEIRWAADGSAVTYINTPHDVSNFWRQPLQRDRPPYKLTDFKSDRLFRFDQSRDGKQFVFSRGVLINDVVMITNFKKH